MKRSLAALALTCVLFGSAMAGTIPTCGAPEPGNTQGPGATAPGDIPSTGISIWLTILDLAF
jgi:hypothetical protein